MTLRTATLPTFYSTDVNFRNYCQMWHDNFAASGMVQTADTGQINLSTVAMPSAINQSRGYEVWRFNDSFQATAPIFVKVEYGSSSAVGSLQMWVTVGTSSDGIGSLGYAGWPGATTLITRRAMGISSGGSTPAQTSPVYFSYLPDNTWGFLAWPSSTLDTTGIWGFAVERFRNADGTTNGEGVSVIHGSNTSYSAGVNISYDARFYTSGAVQPTATGNYWQIPYTEIGVAGTVLGTTMYPVPIFTGCAPRVAAPSQFLLGLGQNDYSAGATFSCDHYGAPHPWISAGPGRTTVGFGNLTPVGFHKSFAFRGD